MAADLAIAAERCHDHGLHQCRAVTDGSSTYYMPRKIGDRRARELMLTNRVLNAQEALDWGVVNQVVADGDVLDAAQKLVQKSLKDPLRPTGGQSAMDSSFDHSLESQMELEARAIAGLVAVRTVKKGCMPS